MLEVSVCITVLNEENTIQRLLSSLSHQTTSINEIVLVDGGSTDGTLEAINGFLESQNTKSQKKIPVHVYSIKGNRSIGRNFAISHAKNNWIAITDAGCIPHKNWLAELIHQQQISKAKVIAGYYDAISSTPFEEAQVPYVLVMPDNVNPQSFLPATRSLLIHKSIWKKAGKFDETLSDNEDYSFAKKIAHIATISFAKAAKVSWLPRKNFSQFHTMIFRFARGDIQAGIIRPKVILIFLRYLFAAGLILILVFENHINLALVSIVLGISVYSIWAIVKNARYTPSSWYWLPILQITSDVAVMSGTIRAVYCNCINLPSGGTPTVSK
jgi:glycosyltransferase involved in cell wall biosynthesis